MKHDSNSIDMLSKLFICDLVLSNTRIDMCPVSIVLTVNSVLVCTVLVCTASFSQ